MLDTQGSSKTSFKWYAFLFIVLIITATTLISIGFYKTNKKIQILTHNNYDKEAILALVQINKEFFDLKLSIRHCTDNNKIDKQMIHNELNILLQKTKHMYEGNLQEHFSKIKNFDHFFQMIYRHIEKAQTLLDNKISISDKRLKIQITAILQPIEANINAIRLALIAHASANLNAEETAIQQFIHLLTFLSALFILLIIALFFFIFLQIKKILKSQNELLDLTSALQKANQIKTSFLAHMSHELRTPLNAIIGFSDILKNEVKKTQHKIFSKDIFDSASHLLTMINDILDISKIESGQREIKPRPFSLERIINESIQFLHLTAKKKNIILIKSFDESNIKKQSFADPLTIKQSLINLLSNAVKFTPNNGTITIEIHENKKQIQCRIIDTGTGMSMEGIKRALTPFQQASSDKYNRGSLGTGLGLPITKSLIELNHGTFNIKSKMGKGTIISFTLPLYIKASK